MIEMSETIIYSKVFENMQAILVKPALYSAKITRFVAGGLGACAYSDDISIAELVRCWQHEEYQTTCPDCGEKAYIIYWAGSVNGGGYKEIVLYCPSCGEEKHSPLNRFGCRAHWLEMRDILREERELINKEAEGMADLLNENEEAVSLAEQLAFLIQQENIAQKQEIEKRRNR